MFANNALLGGGVKVRVWIREQRKINRRSKAILDISQSCWGLVSSPEEGLGTRLAEGLRMRLVWYMISIYNPHLSRHSSSHSGYEVPSTECTWWWISPTSSPTKTVLGWWPHPFAWMPWASARCSSTTPPQSRTQQTTVSGHCLRGPV